VSERERNKPTEREREVDRQREGERERESVCERVCDRGRERRDSNPLFPFLPAAASSATGTEEQRCGCTVVPTPNPDAERRARETTSQPTQRWPRRVSHVLCKDDVHLPASDTTATLPFCHCRNQATIVSHMESNPENYQYFIDERTTWKRYI